MAQMSTTVNLQRYGPQDSPASLRLLLKAARTMNRPVEMIFIDRDDEPCGGIVRIVDVGRETVRIASETGTEREIRCWDVWHVVLLDADEGRAA